MLRIARMMFCAFEAPNDQGAAAAVADKPDDKIDQEPAAKTVPLSELQKERKARRDLEQRLAGLEQQAEERRQAELSESERLKEQLAQAEAARSAAEARAQKVERRGWVRDAAVKAGFIDPGDAVAQIDVSELDSESAAHEAVGELKDRKPHLAPKTTTPAPPELTQVLKDGQRPEDKNEQAGKLLSKAELDALTPAKVNELDSSQPGLIERSYAALAP